MIEDIKQDLYRYHNFDKTNISSIQVLSLILKYFLISSSFRAILFYRLSIYSHINSLKHFFSALGYLLSGIYISPTTKIGKGFLLGNPKCIVIHPKCIIGENVSVLHGVVIGGNIYKTRNSQVSPIIGDNVFIGTGAKILGPINIGKNSMIGANAVVVKDIPNDSVAVGIPAKIVKQVDENFMDISDRNR